MAEEDAGRQTEEQQPDGEGLPPEIAEVLARVQANRGDAAGGTGDMDGGHGAENRLRVGGGRGDGPPAERGSPWDVRVQHLTPELYYAVGTYFRWWDERQAQRGLYRDLTEAQRFGLYLSLTCRRDYLADAARAPDDREYDAVAVAVQGFKAEIASRVKAERTSIVEPVHQGIRAYLESAMGQGLIRPEVLRDLPSLAVLTGDFGGGD